MKFPLKTPEEYGLPAGVEVIRELESAKHLEEGDVFLTGSSGLLYRFEGYWADDISAMCNYSAFDAMTGGKISFGAGESFLSKPIFLMRVPEGFLKDNKGDKTVPEKDEKDSSPSGLASWFRLKLTEFCHSLPKF